MKIIGVNINRKGIRTSDGRFCYTPPYLEFLNNLCDKYTILVFDNLDACVANLAHLIKLSQSETARLLDSKSKMTHIAPYTIQYKAGKSFMIAIGWHPALRKIAHFSDMSQYCQELRRFDITDSLERAKLAQDIGRQVYDIFVSLGDEPHSLTSPVSSFRKSVFRNLNMPMMADIPEEASYLAYQACKGGWAEAFATGHFKEVLDYDINGCFPSTTAKLIDIRDGKWVKSIKQIHLDNATYGYLEGMFETDKPFHPVILHKDSNNTKDKNFTPTGKYPTGINLAMYRYIKEKNLGEFTITNGIFFYANANAKLNPLSAKANELYIKKQEATGLKREIIKVMLEGGFYGLFLQMFGNEFSEYTNFPYACEIQTNAQIAVHRACLESGIMPLAIAVDGVITTADKPLNVALSDKLGEWKLNARGKALIVSSQAHAIENKYNGKEFSLDYDWMIDYAKENPNANCFKLDKITCVSLPLAYTRNNIVEVGSLQPETRKILIRDDKRIYPKYPTTLSELINNCYSSQPYSAELLMALNNLADNEIYLRNII